MRQESESSESSECELKIVETDGDHSAGSDDRETPHAAAAAAEEREPVKKTKAKAAKAAKASEVKVAAASEVKAAAASEAKDERSERVSKEETDSTREMLKTIVASLNEADAAKLLRRANLLEQVGNHPYHWDLVFDAELGLPYRGCHIPSL